MGGSKPWQDAGLAAVLALAVCVLYAPVRGFAWLAYDDPAYVTQNPHVLAGFTRESVAWAFAAAHAGNWHPLTWLSHMLDVTCFGADPAGPHLVNAALHAANAALLFALLLSLTGRRGASFAAAALWALHPLQLESVAWVAERKNVLSTAFGLLALLAWTSWTRRGGAPRYAAALALFAASLMAKAMLVTLPCVLLLLDGWPLGRWRTRADLRRLLLEKLPFFALAAAVSAHVWLVQARAGAMDPAAHVPALLRLAYLPIAYARHLAHAFWPFDLAVLYPHPLLVAGGALAPGVAALAVLALAALTGLALLAARRGERAPLVGWLFFLGTLVPVSGLVPIGWQALADRYAYVPGIGLAVAGVWSAAAALERIPSPAARRLTGALAAGSACVLLAAASAAQLGHWRDSRSLFERALAVTGPNPVMHNELGVLFARHGQALLAFGHFGTAVKLAPQWAAAHQNLGMALAALGKPEEGLRRVERGLALAPERAAGHLARAQLLLDLGRFEDAREPLAKARALDFESVRLLALEARLALAHPDPSRRDLAAGLAALERALAASLAPDPELLAQLASAYAESGRLDDAIDAQRRAVAATQQPGPLAERRARLAQLERDAAAGR